MAETGVPEAAARGRRHEPPPKPKRFWWRFTLAAVLIIVVSAAATSTSILLYIDSIANALSHNNVLQNKVERYLAKTDGGEPENILILGSDKRASLPGDPGRSDTTILLRLDPDRNAIAVMSIPRDLKVEIPGSGPTSSTPPTPTAGPKLTLQVVKELTGLPINHVVNVDFLGFVRAVDAIGCVYVDVDRRYYHSNAGVPPPNSIRKSTSSPATSCSAGKKRCSTCATATPTPTSSAPPASRTSSATPASRSRSTTCVLDQQRPDRHLHRIHDVRHQRHRDDARSAETLRRLAQRVDQRGPLPGRTRAQLRLRRRPEAIDGAVEQFLGIEASGGSRGDARRRRTARRSRARRRSRRSTHDRGAEAARQRRAGARRAKPAKPRRRSSPARSAAASRSSTRRGCPRAPPTSGKRPLRTHRRTRASTTSRTPTATATAPTGWSATVELPDGIHYFGMQGIQGWADPPILDNPSETRTIHGREYEIFVDGDRVKLIAWHRGDNSYWIVERPAAAR